MLSQPNSGSMVCFLDKSFIEGSVKLKFTIKLSTTATNAPSLSLLQGHSSGSKEIYTVYNNTYDSNDLLLGYINQEVLKIGSGTGEVRN